MTTTTARPMPDWKSSAKAEFLEDQLHLFNSFTRKKVSLVSLFVVVVVVVVVAGGERD